MKPDEREFFETMKKFRKLNISSILPDITHGDFAVMKAIESCMKEQDMQCVRVSEVVKAMHIAAPAISRCFKVLEGKHYILRTIDTRDRRNTCVELTAEGRKVLSETEEILNSFADAVLGEMGSEDMRVLNAYLERLVETARHEIEKRTIKKRRGTVVDEENI